MKRIFDTLLFSLRLIAKSPVNAILCVFVLAGGIAIVTSMFSLSRMILFCKAPYADSDRIAMLLKTDDRGTPHNDWRFNSYQRLLEEQDIFTDSCPYFSFYGSLLRDGRSERLLSCYVGANLSEFVGVGPILGRAFNAGDSKPDSEPVALIGEHLWKTTFGGRPSILGSSITINGVARTVVGVMPDSFDGPLPLTGVQAWIPFDSGVMSQETGWGYYVSVLVKIRPNISRVSLSKRADALVCHIASEIPDENRLIVGAKIRYLNGELFDDSTRAFCIVLFACAVLILLMACGIASGLMTARYATRSQEIAVRSALGASRWQIVSQMLVEFVVISASSTALGLLLDRWITVSFMLDNFRGFHLPGFLIEDGSGSFVWFVPTVLVVVTLLSTLLPALRASRTDISSILRESTRTGSSQRITNLSKLLIIWQVAVAGAILGGGMMMGYIVYEFCYGMDSYDQNKYVCATFSFNQRDHPDAAKRVDLVNRIMDQFQNHPEIEKYGMTEEFFYSYDYTTNVSIDGVAYPDADNTPRAAMRIVSPGYFAATNVPLILGREFEKEDNVNLRKVAIVTDAFAKKHFGGVVDAMGKRFKANVNGNYLTVVGVVPDIMRSDGTDRRPEGFFVPYGMAQWQDMILFAKANASPEKLGETLRDIIGDVDGRICVSDVMTVSEYRRLNGGGLALKFFFQLFLAFSIGALVMASAGLYGIISFSVDMKRRDTGIRLALGADPFLIIVSGARSGIVNAAIGIALAVPGVIVIRHFVISLFMPFVPSAENWIVYACSFAILSAVVMVSIMLPAIHGAIIEPSSSLREE